MRIDLYLKKSRLIKRRKLSKEACEKKRVIVNGKVVKPSYTVVVDDVITLKLGAKTIVVKAIDLQASKDKMMYELVSEEYNNKDRA